MLAGVVRVSTLLDYDESPNRTFIVVAYDNGIPSLSSTATVFVRLSNTNKYPPVFDPVSRFPRRLFNILVSVLVSAAGFSDSVLI